MTRNEIDLNSVVHLPQDPSDIDRIKYEYLDTSKYSKSALFLLPMIGLDMRNRIVIKLLENVYLDDFGFEHEFVRPLFLLFRMKGLRDIDFRDLCKAIKSREPLKSNYVMEYYVGFDEGFHYIMLVFRIPEKWAADFYHFKAGRYSQFSVEYKKNFSEKTLDSKGNSVESDIWGAINKTNSLKDKICKEFELDRSYVDTFDELMDLPRREREYYRLTSKTQPV